VRFAPVDMLDWARDVTTHVPCHIGRSGMPVPPRAWFAEALAAAPLAQADERGDPEGRRLLGERFGIGDDELLLAPGTTGANFLAIAALVEEGDEVIVEQPTYGPLLQAVQALTGNVRRLVRPMAAGFQPDLDALAAMLSARTKLVVLTDMHNPSGVRMPAATVHALVDLVERCSPAHVLFDEVYLEMIDEPRATAYARGRRVVTTRSLTKAYGLGQQRAGWITGPRDVIKRAYDVKNYVGAVDAMPGITLLAEGLRRRAQLQARLHEALAAQARLWNAFAATRDDLETVAPAVPFLFFPNLGRAVASRDFCDRLRREHGVAVVPGEFFDAPGHVRIGAIGLPALLAEGLPKLAQLLDSLPRA